MVAKIENNGKIKRYKRLFEPLAINNKSVKKTPQIGSN